ncbi:MAG: hypothetical protein AABZ24_11585, partial [Nitrospirota bacterium]
QWDLGDEAAGQGYGLKGRRRKCRKHHESAACSTTRGVMSVQSLWRESMTSARGGSARNQLTVFTSFYNRASLHLVMTH